MKEIRFSQGSFFLSSTLKKTVMLVCGGRKPNANWLKEASKNTSLCAVDKGLDYCLLAKKMPLCVYGDEDSGSKRNLKKAKSSNVNIKTFPREKDKTDLQLFLENLPQKINLLVSGVWGGRFDHLYSNVFSLLNFKLKNNAQVVLADNEELMILLKGGEKARFIVEKLPKAISLIPLEEKNIVSIKGVKWPLKEAELLRNNPYAISNELIEKKIEVQCKDGAIGFYLKF